MHPTEASLRVCATCGDLFPPESTVNRDDVGRCPKCVQLGKTVKWPGIRVDSVAFVSMAASERLYRMSCGYLQSAKSLCHELGEHPEMLEWSRASVVYFCLHHAAELFLKACILLRAPTEKLWSHDVSKLQDRYCELYSDLKDVFHIETPWDIGLKDVEKTFRLGLDIEDFEYKPDQVYRYMGGKSEATPRALHSFSPGMCLLMAERLESESAAAWAAAKAKPSVTDP